MLTSLKIKNIALVEKAALTFASGMSVLTGETGAGKSIIITALSLALGGRAEREFIRHGADTGDVVAIFDVSAMPAGFRREYSDYIQDGSIEVHRTVSSDGVSRVTINGKRISLAQLKAVTSPIGEILGQHANQMLMNEDNHLAFLDSFAGLTERVEALAEIFTRYRSAANELRRIRDKRELLLQERELLLFQKDEIQKACLRTGEEQELLTERKILDSARELMTSSSTIGQLLDGEGNSALDLMGMARKELDRMVLIDSALEAKTAEAYDIYIRIEELRRFMEQYGSSIADDPARIEEINLRLDEIYNLKKKYGGSEEAVLSTLDLINEKLARRPEVDHLIASLEDETETLFDEYRREAVSLSQKRHKAAGKLQNLVEKELTELAIDGSRFELEFVYEDDPDGIIIDGRPVKPFEHGLEKARFLFSANPGEPPRSLVKTASGGEISRMLLALKSAAKASLKEQGSLLIFDEVDAGIGGQTAIEVGKKLNKLSSDCQLIVVTHLHQIARQADHHYVVDKTRRDDNRHVISVRRLDKDGIATELDRMIALPV